jgi:hypothetical protein
MLIGLKKPLIAGEKIPLTLTFEKAGNIGSGRTAFAGFGAVDLRTSTTHWDAGGSASL